MTAVVVLIRERTSSVLKCNLEQDFGFASRCHRVDHRRESKGGSIVSETSNCAYQMSELYDAARLWPVDTHLYIRMRGDIIPTARLCSRQVHAAC